MRCTLQWGWTAGQPTSCLCRDGGGLLPRQAAAKTQQVRRVTPQEGYSTKCSSLSKLWLAAEPWEHHPGCGQVKVGLRKQMLVMNEVPLFCYCCIWMLPMGGRWEVLKLRALLQCHCSYMEATKPPLQHGNKLCLQSPPWPGAQQQQDLSSHCSLLPFHTLVGPQALWKTWSHLSFFRTQSKCTSSPGYAQLCSAI